MANSSPRSSRWKSRRVPLSNRGFELYWNQRSLGHLNEGKSVLTIENYCKWYSLYLISPDWKIESVGFPDCGNYQQLGSPYSDHHPSPRHVLAFSLIKGYECDADGFGAIVAEWNALRLEWAGLEDYELHPVDLLGKNWQALVLPNLERSGDA